MVCTFIPIKQPKKKAQETKKQYVLNPARLQEKRDCYDEEYPAVA